MYGHENQPGTYSSPFIKTPENAANSSFSKAQNNLALTIRYVSSAKEKENEDQFLVVDDDDDDEIISFKKHLEDSSYATSSVFFAQFNCSKNTLPFSKSFSCNTSYRYLIFQVFRV